MTDDWIIDVLTDLNKFARNNGMMALAEHLDDAKLIAASELMGQSKRQLGVIGGHAETSGKRPRSVGASTNI